MPKREADHDVSSEEPEEVEYTPTKMRKMTAGKRDEVHQVLTFSGKCDTERALLDTCIEALKKDVNLRWSLKALIVKKARKFNLGKKLNISIKYVIGTCSNHALSQKLVDTMLSRMSGWTYTKSARL